MPGNSSDKDQSGDHLHHTAEIASLKVRVDTTEKHIDTLSETLTAELNEIKKDVKDILAWVNRSKGSIATIILVVSTIGGVAGAFVHAFWN